MADGEVDSSVDIGAWSIQVHATYERLLLRLPVDDQVSEAYLAARERLVEVAKAFQDSRPDAEISGAVDRFESARSTYLDCARQCLAQESDGK